MKQHVSGLRERSNNGKERPNHPAARPFARSVSARSHDAPGAPGQPHFIPEERLQRDLQLRWELPDITGYLRLGNRTIPVEQLKAVLVRLRQSLYANMGPGQTPW